MREITKFEERYNRIKDFIRIIPYNVYVSMRNHILNPKVFDHLMKNIKKNHGYIILEYKNEWQICFRDENDLSELLKQIA